MKISFNGKPVGHVFVEYIGLEDVPRCSCRDHDDDDNVAYAEGENYYRELFVIDSDRIIEHNSENHTGLAELKFEVKDNLFRYDLLDSDGNIIKMSMMPISYIHTVNTSVDGPSKDKQVPMNRYSKEERRKAR